MAAGKSPISVRWIASTYSASAVRAAGWLDCAARAWSISPLAFSESSSSFHASASRGVGQPETWIYGNRALQSARGAVVGRVAEGRRSHLIPLQTFRRRLIAEPGPGLPSQNGGDEHDGGGRPRDDAGTRHHPDTKAHG